MNILNFSRNSILIIKLIFLSFVITGAGLAQAASTREIDIKTDAAIGDFMEKVDGADSFLKEAKGVLVFPEIVKAGVGIGGEYGEGVLRINGESVDYFSITGVSLGLQLGGQLRSIILIFMDDNALDNFLKGNGWDIGVDGSVTLIETGFGKSINTTSVDDPVVGFLISNNGLMFNLTLEGSKIQQLDISKQSYND